MSFSYLLTELNFPFPLPKSSFTPCVLDLNLNRSLLPASLTPCKYTHLESYLHTTHSVQRQLNFIIKPFIIQPQCLGYLSSGIDANIYHHFNFALSLWLLKRPLKQLHCKFQKNIVLALPSITDSKTFARFLLQSHAYLISILQTWSNMYSD